MSSARKLKYIELKTGHADDGPAWIARVVLSRSGRSLYFDRKALLRSKQCISGNYIDLETREEYWVSGVKKDGCDRHWAGYGIVDRSWRGDRVPRDLGENGARPRSAPGDPRSAGAPDRGPPRTTESEARAMSASSGNVAGMPSVRASPPSWLAGLAYQGAQLLALAALLLDLVTIGPSLPDFRQHLRAVAAAGASLLLLLLAWKRLPPFVPVLPLAIVLVDLFVLKDAGGRCLQRT